MIAFGCSVRVPEVYERRARLGIERAAEPDSEILVDAAAGSIARGYNLLVDCVADRDDLEALVILHADAEIVDPDFCANLRRAFADPDVAVVGVVGTQGVQDMSWWDGTPRGSAAPYHYGELGGGVLHWTADARASGFGDVDALYGVMLALSPWAVRNLRFDETIGMVHGYDFDICRQARAAGRKAITADLRIAHHHSLDLVKDSAIWIDSHMRAADRFEAADGAEPTEEQWKRRARHAEASAAAARLLHASRMLQAEATAQYHAGQLDAVVDSRSWRLTAPLRRANRLARATRERLAQR
jgi:GT2 family glycosyltransferase